MEFAVLDACFSESKQSAAGMSAQYLKWELGRHGKKEVEINKADILLVSCQSTLSVDFLKKLKKKYRDKVIISGGAASTSPYSLGLYSDIVCVGDGQNFIDVLINQGIEQVKKLPNAWINGEDRLVDIDMGFPWDMPPIQADDNAFRVWCGRGCKKKCFFCQTGWGYEYKENPNPLKILKQIKYMQKNNLKFGYLSNDVMQHTFYSKLPDTGHGSYSVDYLKKNGLPPARQIRLGVEGVSERLRTLVNKKISRGDLINCTSWLNQNGKSVRWFMIAGLPGETKEDWEELKETINKWKMITPKGVLALSFTAWCPDPATPLAIQPLRDDYYAWFEEFKEWFFGGIGWSNRVKIMIPQKPDSRLIKAMYSMGLNEKQLRAGGNWGPNDRLNYPYKEQVKKIGQKIWGELNG